MPATSMVGGRIPTSHCWPGQGVQRALVLYRGRGGFSSLPLYNPPSNPKKPLPQRIAPENCFSHRVSLSLFEKPPKCDFEVIFLKPLKKFIWRFALGFSRAPGHLQCQHLSPTRLPHRRTPPAVQGRQGGAGDGGARGGHQGRHHRPVFNKGGARSRGGPRDRGRGVQPMPLRRTLPPSSGTAARLLRSRPASGRSRGCWRPPLQTTSGRSCASGVPPPPLLSLQ